MIFFGKTFSEKQLEVKGRKAVKLERENAKLERENKRLRQMIADNKPEGGDGR